MYRAYLGILRIGVSKASKIYLLQLRVAAISFGSRHILCSDWKSREKQPLSVAGDEMMPSSRYNYK